MYVGVLNTQKTALIDDADKLQSRLSEGCHHLLSVNYTTSADCCQL